MTGALWAAAAGVGFGLFQSVNRLAIADMDVYRSTFLQLVTSAAILLTGLAVRGDLSELGAMPMRALVNFAAAGLVHFFLGWTLLNMSQKRLGAARTSPLIATTPLFGTLIAAVTLGEVPGGVSIAGIVTIVGGASLVGMGHSRRPAGVVTAAGSAAVETMPDRLEPPGLAWTASLAGLGAAMAWAISPIFIRRGLREIDAPLAGVTVSMIAAVVAYGLALLLRRPRRAGASSPSRRAVASKLIAGALVGLATWTRWYALSLLPVAEVLGLALLSVPTVMVLAPLLAGRDVERVTVPVLGGAALVIAGALVLITQR